ncbi:MAG: acyltransferase [Clostridia bacterium]|nr:acyltransferase [Clostridia bacterium]
MSIIDQKLNEIRRLVDEGMTCKNAAKALKIIGIDGYDERSLREFKLWNDYMPLDMEYDECRRNLHILWDSVDRVPLGVNCAFAIPFRQILAKKLFKSCGDGFVANEGCRFNFANNIEIGENVSWNAGCYLDAKGGIKLGDFSMLTEYVKIFTHSHSEGDHMVREYNGVEIGDYAKVYTAATILPGVKLGTGAIVATGAIVTKSVEEFTLVGGIPAKPMRKRNFDGKDLKEMNQYMMKDRLFQVYQEV